MHSQKPTNVAWRVAGPLIGFEFAQGYFFSKPIVAIAVGQALMKSEANYYTLWQESLRQLAGTAK